MGSNVSRETKNNDRFNQILDHPSYREYLKMNEEAEIDRSFCRHDLSHFLDVARIAYIMNLEQNLGLSKDLIYGVALLHDIGRWRQYQENIPHDVASVELAKPILADCGYQEVEREQILGAILSHRFSGTAANSLNDIIYKADKASRACFCCKASPECNWPEDKKNHKIKY